MFVFLVISVLVLAVVVAGSFFYLGRRKRKARIAEMLSGTNLLAAWTYDPDEWRQAVEEEYTWIRNKDGGVGHCYISPSGIYIKNDSQDRLIDLSGNGKVVTHASYRGADRSSPLKLRVRWRVVTTDKNGNEQIKYFKEDYRIPVPIRNRDDAARVADFFIAKLENNLAAYTAVVPDDEPISLFGKDSF